MRDNVTQSTQSTQSARRRNPAYGVLIGIILLTIPCYLIGFAALYILQRNVPGLPTPQVTVAPSATTLNAPTATLGALLPTEFMPPSATSAVPTVSSPTLTPPPTLFGTLPPATVITLAPTMTETPTPSATPTLDIPTSTPTPVPFIPVDTPTATATQTDVPPLEPTAGPTVIAPAP